MNIFEVVKANVRTIDAAMALGFHPSKSGMICCPFHDDNHPSMKVDGRFHCFGCGADGDVIDFVGKLYNLSPLDSARKIAVDFCIPIDDKPYGASPEVQKKIHDSRKRKQRYELERDLARKMNELTEKLQNLINETAPSRGDSEWSPLFSFAHHEKCYLDYLSDYWHFEATDEDRKQEYAGIKVEVDRIEERYEKLVRQSAGSTCHARAV